jgi:Fe-Mn family superoxide dismutase
MNIIEPINLKFDLYEPLLKEKQTTVHYNGHYKKYINNLNQIINDNKTIKEIYCKTKKIVESAKFKKLFLLVIIDLFKDNMDIVNNASQIYNHELYWKTMTNTSESLQSFCKNKNQLFRSQEDYKEFYNKYISLGSKHFGSGWLWIIYNNNKLDVMTTHDATIPVEYKILGVIDLWEHAYYLDYEYERKKYLIKTFYLINWEKLFLKINKIKN